MAVRRLVLAMVLAVVATAAAPLAGPDGAAFAADPVARRLVGSPIDPSPLGGRCGDPAGAWLDLRWPDTLHWQFNAETTPGYLWAPAPRPGQSAVLASIRAAARAVTTGLNDCGLVANLAMSQHYDGDTGRRAAVTAAGGCGARDGHNVVSFGTLPLGLLAVTCVWWEGRGPDSRSVEADILIDATAGTFFLAPPADCRTRWDLESILTHEFGHVFGLGHVPYDQHSSLTMSDAIPECTAAYRGLGLGDLLTLRWHYGQ